MTIYWRERLDTRGQYIYDLIFNSVNSGQLKIKLPENNIDRFEQIVGAFTSDHPEFFWLSPSYCVESQSARFGLFGGRGGGLAIQFKSLYPQIKIPEIKRKLESVAESIAHSYDGSVESAEKQICDYIVKNVEYKVNNLQNQNVASALYFGRAQCSGIARATKYIMDRLGKWCIVVNGVADANDGIHGPHSWNIVRIGNKYYHLDPTYLLGANAGNNSEIRFVYFNYSDNKMRKTHEWDFNSTPRCDDTSNDTGGVPEISSLYEMRQLLSASNKVKFIYNSEKEISKLQQLITENVKMFCEYNGYYGRINISYAGGVWEIEYNIRGD